MTKQVIAFITTSIILSFIIGCPAPKPETAEPPQAKLPEPEPIKIELPKIITTPKPKIDPAAAFHEKYADILTNFVDNTGMVDYRILTQKRTQLKSLLNEFDKLNPDEYNSWPKEDKIALWLNAYNIQMLKIIIDNYPIQSSRFLRVLWPPTSIRHIPPSGIIGAQKWDQYKFMVMDEQFTLSEIERRFFREKFQQPRVFFAVSHASLSSPPLRNEPYYGHKLYRQLDDQVKKFLSNPNAFKIDRKKQIVYLSAIFQPDWYGNEFINKFGTDKKFKDHNPPVRAILNFLTDYISDEDASFLEVQNYSVKYISYDWRLNE